MQSDLIRNPRWTPAVARWMLRVLLPLVMSIGLKLLLLWFNDFLTWGRITREPAFLLFSMTVSIISLIDLIVLSQRTPTQPLGGYTLILIASFSLTFVVAFGSYTIYSMIDMRGIPDLPALIAMQRAAYAGLWLAVLLFLLSILTLFLEIYDRLPGPLRQNPATAE